MCSNIERGSRGEGSVRRPPVVVGGGWGGDDEEARNDRSRERTGRAGPWGAGWMVWTRGRKRSARGRTSRGRTGCACGAGCLYGREATGRQLARGGRGGEEAA